jgi:uncharacterized membrane protein YphA (DoxX/SURF4 family)
MVSRAFSVLLALLRFAVGLGLVLPGIQKLSWFGSTAGLETQLSNWGAHPANQFVTRYLAFASQHVGVLARMTVAGELIVGGCLILGLLTPLMALLGFLMVLNFSFASGQMFTLQWFSGSSGLAYLISFLVIFAGRGGTALGLDGILAGRRQRAN